jgi:hypothetical protein
MRWYVGRCAELNNKVKEDMKVYRQQLLKQQQLAARQQQMVSSSINARIGPEDPLGAGPYQTSEHQMHASLPAGRVGAPMGGNPQMHNAPAQPERGGLGGFHDINPGSMQGAWKDIL